MVTPTRDRTGLRPDATREAVLGDELMRLLIITLIYLLTVISMQGTLRMNEPDHLINIEYWPWRAVVGGDISTGVLRYSPKNVCGSVHSEAVLGSFHLQYHLIGLGLSGTPPGLSIILNLAL